MYILVYNANLKKLTHLSDYASAFTTIESELYSTFPPAYMTVSHALVICNR